MISAVEGSSVCACARVVTATQAKSARITPMDRAGTRLGHRENQGEKREARKQFRFVLSTECGTSRSTIRRSFVKHPLAMALFFAKKSWKHEETNLWEDQLKKHARIFYPC